MRVISLSICPSYYLRPVICWSCSFIVRSLAWDACLICSTSFSLFTCSYSFCLYLEFIYSASTSIFLILYSTRAVLPILISARFYKCSIFSLAINSSLLRQVASSLTFCRANYLSCYFSRKFMLWSSIYILSVRLEVSSASSSPIENLSSWF